MCYGSPFVVHPMLYAPVAFRGSRILAVGINDRFFFSVIESVDLIMSPLSTTVRFFDSVC